MVLQVSSEYYQRHFECGADFSCLVKATAFLDKTLFIKEFINQAPKSVLTVVPKYFGKSTNIDMLKRFLEIEVDEMGTPKSKTDYSKYRVTDTGNYDMFVKQQLGITKHDNIMENYLGRHPVISVDFSCDRVTSYSRSINCCKRVLHLAFLQHKYLLQSKILNDEEKQICRMWCDNGTYFLSEAWQVRSGLNMLSGYLYKHFKRTVFVLIDNYDHLITNAMFGVNDESVLRRIMKFNVDVLSDVLMTYNDSVVAQGLLTGAAYIDGMDWFRLSNVVRCRFLEKHAFTGFYGVSRGEVNSLFTNLEFTFDLSIEDARKLLQDGFTTVTGRRVYSYRSIMIHQ